MKIEVFQSGGFAGDRIKRKEINSENIPSEKQRLLKDFLTKSHFYNLEKNVKSDEIGADMLEYEIIIEDDEHNIQSVKFTDAQSQRSLKDLLGFIMAL